MQKFSVLIALFVVLTMAACVQTSVPLPSSQSGALPPVIIRFEASPSTISTGDTSNLVWEISNGATASIDQGIGPVALKGSNPVSPLGTTTYTLTAANKYGSNTATAQVILTGPKPAGNPQIYNLPAVTVFTAEPANILSGSTAVLKWEVQNSFDVEIAPGFSIIPARGSREINPEFTTNYKLTARNGQGTIVASTTLTVSFTPPDQETPVIKFFKATPYVIKKGESVVLSWESKEGSSATIDNKVGTVDGTGTFRVSPENTTTYMLTVTNPRGAQFQTTTVNVR